MRFEAQRSRFKQDLILLGQTQLREQQLPIYQPSAEPKRTWTKRKDKGKSTARALTANELAQKQAKDAMRKDYQQLRYLMGQAEVESRRNQE